MKFLLIPSSVRLKNILKNSKLTAPRELDDERD